MPIRVTQWRDGDQAELERLVRSRTVAQRVVERARIVLASASGLKNAEICSQVGVTPPTVMRWLNRYETHGIDGLLRDRPRSGKPRQIPPEKEAEIVRLSTLLSASHQ
jgi:transposase